MSFVSPFKRYSKSQRNGIYLLILIILLIQVSAYSLRFFKENKSTMDIMLTATQRKIDSLLLVPKSTWKIKPFNPNYISDDKAYYLGMSVDEIDRILIYRKNGGYVNSLDEFQRVTLISDSLLKSMAVYFKFSKRTYSKLKKRVEKKERSVKDINKATLSDLLEVKGIGEKRASRILKYRKLLGGFSLKKQLDEVWGLPQEVLDTLKERFKILSKPRIKKIDINKATVNELSSIVYIGYKQAEMIVDYRLEVAEIQNLAELKTISNFPVDKFDLISLYLQAQ